MLFRQSTIIEMDSTGSILSDLNCLSKSEDDLDTKGIPLQSHKCGDWKEHEASCKNQVYKQPSTLDKVAEFNSSEKTTAAAKSNDGTFAASAKVTPGDIDSDKSVTKVHHSFVSKMVIKPETCISCGKR